MDEPAVNDLQALGLSLYEARVYVGLLRRGTQNGNELSKATGVPSSKIYSTLERLANAGIVEYDHRDTTTHYSCISHVELLDLLGRKFREPLDSLTQELPKIAGASAETETGTIRNLRAIHEVARLMVRRVERELYLSLWPEELVELEGELEAAGTRPVKIFGMLYDDKTSVGVGVWENHSYPEIVHNRLGGRMLTLVADGLEALIAQIPTNGRPTAVRTTNPALCLVAEEYLRHDLVLEREKQLVGDSAGDQWWQADPDMRSLILGSPRKGSSRRRRSSVHKDPR